MANEAKRIRYQAENHATVQGIMHYVNEAAIFAEHTKQSAKKAVGVDGTNKVAYGANLMENIRKLIERMRKFQYKPQPVKRAYIPKANGAMRPLGIPAYEDKLVQGAMTRLLSEVYETRFLECSYGFRPGRRAHDVVRTINQIIMTKKVNYVLEADIKGFFDNVNHDWLMKFLEHDIQDKNFLRYVRRFLKAGVMEGTQLMDSDKGTPQGGLISPVLANVYLHYVLDLWIEKVVKPRLKGEVYYVRYADDFALFLQYEEEAVKVMAVLEKRLNKFGLEVAKDKTRILPFGRFRGTKEKFDFLGFTFYNTTTRGGKYRVGIQTSKKKLKAKRQAAKAWIRERMHKPMMETLTLLRSKITGHVNYYGVNGNYKAIVKFVEYLKTTLCRAWTRRSQKSKMTWEKFNRIWEYCIPKPPKLVVNIWNWHQMAY